MQIAWCRRRHRRTAPLSISGRDESEFASGRAVEQPRAQYTVLDQGEPLAGDAFAVERVRAQATPAQWIVDNMNAIREQLGAHLVAEKTGLPRNRSAVCRACQMRNQRAGRTRIEHDRHLAGRNLPWVKPRDGSGTGAVADFFGTFKIGRVTHGGIIVVALHAGALAGDRGHRKAVVRSNIGAAETVAGYEHHPADPGRS